ncbi:MAG: hypothetical protein N2234_08885, partial [Planctomycetota bacterium]|nr:hypothetical protein [Planctomycetota bacterium]
MRSDIDSLMRNRNIDTLIVAGNPGSSTDFLYLTGPVKVTGGYVVKKQGEKPFIVCGLMERDEASKSGLPVKLYSDFNYEKIFGETKNSFEASAKFIFSILSSQRCGRKVALYGNAPIPYTAALLEYLKKNPDFEFVFEGEESVFSAARVTKDENEIALIKEVGRKAQEVYQEVVDYLSSCKEKKGVLYKGRSPVTIGDVKTLIKNFSEELNINIGKEDIIFAQGRDSAVPHSRGESEEVIRT